jgi:hypothetical protein
VRRERESEERERERERGREGEAKRERDRERESGEVMKVKWLERVGWDGPVCRGVGSRPCLCDIHFLS